ncbi:hypothetical protein EYF80_023024 [Liparis tanakae]|uniref:Uncharacterized protein n=1 Tax=Liparis tanakae TaxID=230148 RepID=A0A4Z2HPT2_9TELE|nr:hypothetical protein EYF80_023024 [Liparis tanakae]
MKDRDGGQIKHASRSWRGKVTIKTIKTMKCPFLPVEAEPQIRPPADQKRGTSNRFEHFLSGKVVSKGLGRSALNDSPKGSFCCSI